ncbi:MAG: hypothetical protein AAGB97_09245 [Dehalococcoidia bacterium]|nr:hypothetical protein [Chloroflexota bacterium]
MLATKTQRVVDALSQELRFPRETILEQGLKILVEKKLQEIRSEIFQITGKYGISSVEEMEERYKQGTLEEKDTWRDFQRLDHSQHMKERLEHLLRELE